MNIEFQNLIVFALIAGALGFFVVRWWKARRSGGGCSGGCCPAASHKPEPIFRRADGRGKGEAGISITDGGDGGDGGD